MRDFMSQAEIIRTLMRELGERFSSRLNIDLGAGDPEEVFKWFLASILFGARISETIVVNTYRQFEQQDVLSAQKILDTGWDGLVRILDKGGYVRYDFKTATKLLGIMAMLEELYQGDLNKVHTEAGDSSDLEKKLKSLGRSIGDVTANIFLRELRSTWQKADPLPSDLVILSAKNLRLLPPKIKSRTEILKELKSVYNSNKIKGKDFVDLEAALLRLAKDFCRREKCDVCVVENFCKGC